SAKVFETTLVNPIEVSPASLNFETEPGAFNFFAEDIGAVAKEDIATEETGIRFGRGWYPVERCQDELLRWVDNDAALIIDAPAGPVRALRLEIEPGPAMAYRPFELQVRDEKGRTVARGLVESRQVVHLALPLQPEELQRIHLHVDGGGLPTPFDTRTLNFRVFKCGWSDEVQPVAPATDTPGPFNFRAENLYL